jgi:cytochrome P450
MQLAGTDTSANTLAFAIAQLANHQEIQKKLIDEIHSVVGRDRHPTHEDLARMPYLEAVFHETLRRHTVVPWGLGHVVVEDIQVGQYHVPADVRWLLLSAATAGHSLSYFSASHSRICEHLERTYEREVLG